MNPDTKLILDEMAKSFAQQDERWGKRFDEIDAKWESRIHGVEVAHDERVQSIEKVAASLDAWSPEIEGTVDDIRLEVGKLTKHWERTLRDGKSGEPPLIALPNPVSAPPPPSSAADPPHGHRVGPFHREGDHGVVMAVVHPPGTGGGV